MTVTTSVNKTQPLGNGVTTSFPFAFRIYAAADLVVVRTDIATGIDTPLVLNTDYTVTGVGSYNGGNVVFGVAPVTGTRITIRRVVSITQQTDLRNNGAYFAETHEDVFDRLTMVDQQLQEQFSRELLQPISDTAPIGQLPTAAVRADKLFSYDSQGNPTAVYPSSQSATGLQALLALFSGASLIGWIQSGVGAVLRLVQDKLRDTVHVKDFLPAGYVTDASVDYTAYIQNAINELFSRGGGNLDMSGGRWLVDSANLTVKQGVCLRGPWKNAGEISTRDYTSFKSSIILNPLYTINLAEDFSAIKGVVIARKGLTIPTSLAEAVTHVAAFSGKAITVGDGTNNKANDTYAGYCLIIGFQYAYYNDFNERPRIEYLSGDNINGVYLNQIYDMNHMLGCHFWPFTTTHQSWTLTGDAGWRRQGTAYYFGTAVDWGQATNCFSYGYDKHVDVNGSDNVVLLNCGGDGWKDNNNYSIGYHARGTTRNLNLIGCKVSSKNTSVLVDLTGGGNSQSVKIKGGNLWAASVGTGSHVYVKNGNAIITGGVSMFDGPVGVKSDSTAGMITVTNDIFQTIATPYAISNLNNSLIRDNQYVNSTDAVGGTRAVYDNQFAEDYKVKYSADVNPMRIVYRKSRGTSAAPTIVGSNESILDIDAAAFEGTTFGIAARLSATTRGASSAGATPGAWIFSTTSAGAAVPTQRIIVSEGGHFFPLADNVYACGSSGFAWANNYSRNFRPGTGTAIWTSGAGTPEAVVTAPVGSLYTNTSGGASTTLYVKETGAGNTGWVAK
jgi:hypothetical protein